MGGGGGSRFIFIIVHGVECSYFVCFKNLLMANERICLHDSVANEWQRVKYCFFFVLGLPPVAVKLNMEY